jgi:L-threonylcarbamoyladenylate synthase
MASKDITVFPLSTDGFLDRSVMYGIMRSLKRGALTIVPSDTTYSLCGIPFLRGVCDDIDLILSRDGRAISLAFGTQALAERYVVFNRGHLRLIDEFTPGPLTVVAPMRKDLGDAQRKALSAALRTENELGVRFPKSWSEIQLSCELERPLTTAAILYRNGAPVKNFDDAVDIISEGRALGAVDREILAIRRRRLIAGGELSSVVTALPPDVEPGRIVMIREGALSEADIRKAVKPLDRYVARDFDEWT